MWNSRRRGESGLGHLAFGRFTPLDRRGLDRRIFIGGSLCLLAAPAAWARSADRGAALANSKLVYISPLKSNGNESACHAEVWFGWLDGSVVINTSPDRWKARAVKQGLERARIWVGDFGPWKQMLGKNEKFRQGPQFDAKVEIVKDDALIDRLLKQYDEKYPEKIVSWRDKMRNGYFDGSRVLIRYTPFD
ncbi:MAG: hypothetical protein IH884_14170 [Myxococcales bacterium]|nr:hypothetical protein [Myxococcales bacterium]